MSYTPLTYEQLTTQPLEQTLPQLEQNIADLRQRLSALGELDDVPNTPRAQEIFWRDRSMYDGRVRTLTAAAETLASVEPAIATYQDWQALFTKIREKLCDEFLPLHPHRNPEYENLKQSILAVDKGLGAFADGGYQLESSRLGELLRAAGYVASPPERGTNAVVGQLPWPGSAAEIERQLKVLRQARFEARKRIAADAKFDEVPA